jgi:ATP-binding cassette subfamily C protein
MANMSHPNHHTLSARVQMAHYFYRRYPRQTVLLLGGLAAAGVLETVGIVSILPLLESLIAQDSMSAVRRAIEATLSFMGLSPTVNVILFLLAAIFGLKALLHLRIARYIAIATSRLGYDQRNEFLRLLLSARWKFFTNRSLGQFVNAALLESSKGSACFIALCQIAESVLRTVMLLVGAALISWQVSVAAIVAGALLGRGLSSFMKVSERTGFATAAANKELSKWLADVLQNIKPLKAMRLEENMFRFIEKQSHILFDSYARQLFARHAMTILREPVIAVFILGGLVAFTNLGVPFAELMILAALFYRAVSSWGVLHQNQQTLATNESYFWSFQKMLKAASEQQEPHKGSRPASFTNSISFDKVMFGYDKKTVIKEASFSVPQNQLTALVGQSGAGKTSIADLISGLHQPQSGSIRIDGVDILDLDISDWRRSIGYVAQEFFMLNDTLRMNIALGDASISDGAIWKALDEAGAGEFVKALAHGLDTQMGERGFNLSGGQRQRISLARALVRKPKLLILDEATTALDPETELRICKTLRAISRYTAVLAISHQKALVDSADRVYEAIAADACGEGGNVRLLGTESADSSAKEDSSTPRADVSAA